MNRIYILIRIQSLLVILVSINRLGSWTLGYVLPNEFLRWVDLNNIIIAMISLLAGYLLKKTIEYNSSAREGRAHMAWDLVFIIGVYLTAVSYGIHEVTNYLHFRSCLDDPSSDLCRIVIFNDDEFSHWLFFAGFTMVNGAILFLQDVFPYQGMVTGGDTTVLLLNSLFLGLGIVANLGFEEIGLDLYIVALVAIIASVLLMRRGRQPMFIYYAAAYWLGLVGSVAAQVLR